MTNVFSTRDYQSFLRETIEQNRGIRGYQSRLAEAAGVHTSYISRVVNGHLHLTPDQAANLARFWRMESEEMDYFLDLVMLERSASPALRTRIQSRLETVRRGRERLDRRFSRAQALEGGILEAYYSAWYISAAHMLLTIPKFRKPPEIARRLGISEETALGALQTLARLGLAKQTQSQWHPESRDLHLGEDLSWARIHHGHWRQKSALKIQEADADALHYSGVHTLAVADARKLKQMLVQFLDSSRRIIAPSPEEELYFLGCDFYEI